jgi:pantetheine-phosphate adenylyltransferase
MKTALYPGTFDPVTLGHVDLVERGLRLFDRIIVAVADNPGKAPLFPLNDRVRLFEEATSHVKGVVVTPFQTLTVEFAKERQACAIIRGLRAISDFDYEFQLAWMNRKLAPDLETVFLCPNERYSFVNSTLVKEIARHGRDVEEFVPAQVAKALRRLYPSGANRD